MLRDTAAACRHEMTSNHDDSDSDSDTSDLIVCIAMVLLSLGVAAVGLAYLFPYDNLTDSRYDKEAIARQTESAEQRAWTAFTVCWLAGLILISLGVIAITCVIVYTNCPCQRAVVISRRGGEVTPLSAAECTASRYGSS